MMSRFDKELSRFDKWVELPNQPEFTRVGIGNRKIRADYSEIQSQRPEFAL